MGMVLCAFVILCDGNGSGGVGGKGGRGGYKWLKKNFSNMVVCV